MIGWIKRNMHTCMFGFWFQIIIWTSSRALYSIKTIMWKLSKPATIALYSYGKIATESHTKNFLCILLQYFMKCFQTADTSSLINCNLEFIEIIWNAQMEFKYVPVCVYIWISDYFTRFSHNFFTNTQCVFILRNSGFVQLWCFSMQEVDKITGIPNNILLL